MITKATPSSLRYLWAPPILLVVFAYSVLTGPLPAHVTNASPQVAFGSGVGFWHTSGHQIVDSNGNPVRITGINWFGMDTNTFCPHGLWARNWKDMLNQIQNLGYNTLRLPFCTQMLDPGSAPNSIDFTKNPDLQGLDPLQILDKIVDECRQIGLRVILDRHALEAGNRTALWYDSTYPESRWISDWEMLALHYKNNPTVVAVDLHNEPHTPSCWGCGSSTLDWRLAAVRAANAVLAVNPHLLILVEGTDCFAPGGGTSGAGLSCTWWGGQLQGVATFPVVLNVSKSVGLLPARVWCSSRDSTMVQRPNIP